jgi:hypothetical protein
MMHFKDTLSVLAGVLVIIAFVPYIRAILKGKTQPEKATWIIWASLDTITFAGMFAKHAANGQIVASVLGAWTIAFLALKYGTLGWTRLDKSCFIGAILGIILWKATGNPLFGLITSLAVMFLGSIPTFVSAWNDPSKEDRTTWTIFWISCVAAMLAIPAITLADAAQPTTFFLIETVMVFILYLRPRMLAHAA